MPNSLSDNDKISPFAQDFINVVLALKNSKMSNNWTKSALHYFEDNRNRLTQENIVEICTLLIKNDMDDFCNVLITEQTLSFTETEKLQLTETIRSHRNRISPNNL